MFRTKAALLFSLFLLSQNPLGHAVDYTYDQKESQVEFSLKHLGMTTAEGYFRAFSGASRFFPQDIERSEVTIQIQTASIYEPKNENRKPPLSSENFFWSDKYPSIQFMSRKFVKGNGAEFHIEGDLTIRGITHPAVFHTKLLTDPAGISENQPLFFTASTFIKRKDYNLGTGGWTNTLAALTMEILEIRLKVKCVPEKISKSSRLVTES